MILVINNRDSFVFNLDRYLRLSGAQTRIIDAQSTSLEQVQRLAPNAIIVSPGPCTPARGAARRGLRPFPAAHRGRRGRGEGRSLRRQHHHPAAG